MRSLLATLAALVLLAGLWVALKAEPSVAAVISAGEPGSMGTDEHPPDELVAVEGMAGEVGGTAVRTEAEETLEGIPRPPGFSQLIVRLREAGRSAVGALVEVPDAADALLNGTPDENGRGVADARGEVAFYVRPTRQVLVKAYSAGNEWTAEASYTTPFEGRTRIVVMNLSSGSSDEVVSLRVVSELDHGPLPGVHVELLGSDLESTTEATTDEEGLVRVPGGRSFRYRLALEGYVDKEVRPEGDEPEFQVVLRPLSRLYGTLVMRDAAAAESTAVYGLTGKGSMRLGPGGKVQVLAPELFNESSAVTSMRDSGVIVENLIHSSWPSWTAVVQGNGSWAVELAIPEGREMLSNLVLTQLTPADGRRVVATVPRIRPGESLLVVDSWGSEPSLAIQFSTPEGAPVGGGKRVAFRAMPRPDPDLGPEASGRVRSDGRVLLPHLRRGRWSYQMAVDGAPPSWCPSGEFFQDGQSEPISVKLTGRSLTVEIASSGEPDTYGYYQMAIVPAGGVATAFTRVREASQHTFPVVPKDGSWEVVLASAKRLRSAQTLDLTPEEILRVSVPLDEDVLVLRP